MAKAIAFKLNIGTVAALRCYCATATATTTVTAAGDVANNATAVANPLLLLLLTKRGSCRRCHRQSLQQYLVLSVDCGVSETSIDGVTVRGNGIIRKSTEVGEVKQICFESLGDVAAMQNKKDASNLGGVEQ